MGKSEFHILRIFRERQGDSNWTRYTLYQTVRRNLRK